jgi:hypothetical protein
MVEGIAAGAERTQQQQQPEEDGKTKKEYGETHFGF